MSAHPVSRSAIELHSTVHRDDRLATVEKAMGELRGLPIGWDGHDGRPLDAAVAEFALRLLMKTMSSGTPLPQLVPLSHGGVQLEWHDGGIDLELEIEAPGRAFLDFEDRETGEVVGHAGSIDCADLSRLLRLLASRQLSAH